MRLATAAAPLLALALGVPAAAEGLTAKDIFECQVPPAATAATLVPRDLEVSEERISFIAGRPSEHDWDYYDNDENPSIFGLKAFIFEKNAEMRDSEEFYQFTVNVKDDIERLAFRIAQLRPSIRCERRKDYVTAGDYYTCRQSDSEAELALYPSAKGRTGFVMPGYVVVTCSIGVASEAAAISPGQALKDAAEPVPD